MTARSKTWEQVGEKFESLGEHLRGHFDEVGVEASSERAAFEKSVRGLMTALEDGFGAAGKAVRDPILRQDVTSVATSVREALLASFETAGEQVRERLARPSRSARPTTTRATAPGTKARKVGAAKATSRTATQHKRAAS